MIITDLGEGDTPLPPHVTVTSTFTTLKAGSRKLHVTINNASATQVMLAKNTPIGQVQLANEAVTTSEYPFTVVATKEVSQLTTEE